MTGLDALQEGMRLHQAGRFQEAEQQYRQVLAQQANHPDALHLLGLLAYQHARHAQAIELISQALRQRPGEPVYLANLGPVYAAQGRHEEAIRCYEKALASRPQFTECIYNLANSLKAVNRLTEAIDHYEKVLEVRPRYPEAWTNLGNARQRQGRFDDAVACYEKALNQQPNQIEAMVGMANARHAQGRFAEAHTLYEQAKVLRPNHADLCFNHSVHRLLQGQLPEAWEDYEYRWQVSKLRLPTLKQPRWDGSNLEGKSIYLIPEQGLGDTLHFVRYAKVLKDQGATTIVSVQSPLVPLISRTPGIDLLLSEADPPPVSDFWSPLLSLPGRFNTRLETIPQAIPYLYADPKRIEHWGQELGKLPGRKIGIAWQGDPSHIRDSLRSIPLNVFALIAKIPEVTLVSLQKGAGCEQLAEWSGPAIYSVGDRCDSAGAFVDTAAVMHHLDLVITADTAIAHLAGGLGLPVWLALSMSPDWRWLLEREDSPWYPTLKLFRQTTLGDWDSVLVPMRQRLEQGAWPERTSPPTAPPSLPISARRSPEESVILQHDFQRLRRGKHGVFLYNRHDRYIGHSMDQYGEFSEGEIELFQQLIRPGDVVLEAGANMGFHTVVLAQFVSPAGKVIAYEPQRILFQTLCANLALSALTNVDARHAALGDKPGSLKVPMLDYAQPNNFGGVSFGQFSSGEDVPVQTIDQLQLPQLRLLKADVEGMESAVLLGASQTIARCRPLLYVENDRKDRSEELLTQMLGWDYRLYWHTPPLFNPTNYNRNPINAFGRIVSINVLGVPAELQMNVAGLRPIQSPKDTWRSLPS